ncbi:MAG: sulfatase-like hydrolase/transferase [Caldilineaceae bacterium]|nr:sulfatase-like hydrolase/transferase [Caldilineaceae bacterium]
MPQPPNILFMIADDHRHDAIHTLGDVTVQTPHLDALANNGTAFRCNYIMGGLSGAVCIPTRACLHTGVNTFGAVMSQTVDDSRNLMTLRPNLPTLGETFRQQGYTTFATGKWHNDKASFQRSFADGARIFFGGMSDHDAVPLHDYDPTGHYADEQRYIGRGFSSELFADAAIHFLQQQSGTRLFFLYLAFTAPHDPRTPPGAYATRYDPAAIPLPANFLPEHPFDNGELQIRDEKLAPWPRTPALVRRHLADYYGMISHMDEQIGRVLATLQATGQWENTIIVYMADHGLALGQHGLLGKQNLYDHSIRVPLLLQGPGIAAGNRVDALTHSYDLYPTLCALAGMPIPAHVEGQSLLPLIDGAPGRAQVCTVYKDLMRSLRQGNWKLIRYYHSRQNQAGVDQIQLFNLADDPWEQHNRAAEPSQQTRIQELSSQ